MANAPPAYFHHIEDSQRVCRAGVRRIDESHVKVEDSQRRISGSLTRLLGRQGRPTPDTAHRKS